MGYKLKLGRIWNSSPNPKGHNLTTKDHTKCLKKIWRTKSYCVRYLRFVAWWLTFLCGCSILDYVAILFMIMIRLNMKLTKENPDDKFYGEWDFAIWEHSVVSIGNFRTWLCISTRRICWSKRKKYSIRKSFNISAVVDLKRLDNARKVKISLVWV